MGLSKQEYWISPVYRKISNRFREKYKINIDNHIRTMTDVARLEQDGITFVPHDDHRLISDLMATQNFHHDNRADVVGRAAASATRGEGYREISDTSLHCQVAADECNIHIDYVGFVARGPNGESYVGPDALQHIADELAWMKLAGWVTGKNKFLGHLVGRLHPILPNASNNYRRVGGQLVLGSGENLQLEKRWKMEQRGKW